MTGQRLVIDPGKAVAAIDAAGQAAGRELFAAISAAAAAIAKERRRRVELAILAGANRVEEPYLLGDANDRRRIVYTVPRWRDHPINRARVEWRRWCYRRSGAGLLNKCDREKAPPRRRGGMVG